ncbi:hypothetical protein ACH5A7_36780 [Streptomyces sp. NPDC018955]|uniref:hypothetical protein n=1 Tax=Streptomyces sp. NPDC018955 TaxID=3365055 RepID=UPI0037B8468C
MTGTRAAAGGKTATPAWAERTVPRPHIRMPATAGASNAPPCCRAPRREPSSAPAPQPTEVTLRRGREGATPSRRVVPAVRPAGKRSLAVARWDGEGRRPTAARNHGDGPPGTAAARRGYGPVPAPGGDVTTW